MGKNVSGIRHGIAHFKKRRLPLMLQHNRLCVGQHRLRSGLLRHGGIFRRKSGSLSGQGFQQRRKFALFYEVIADFFGVTDRLKQSFRSFLDCSCPGLHIGHVLLRFTLHLSRGQGQIQLLHRKGAGDFRPQLLLGIAFRIAAIAVHGAIHPAGMAGCVAALMQECGHIPVGAVKGCFRGQRDAVFQRAVISLLPLLPVGYPHIGNQDVPLCPDISDVGLAGLFIRWNPVHLLPIEDGKDLAAENQVLFGILGIRAQNFIGVLPGKQLLFLSVKVRPILYMGSLFPFADVPAFAFCLLEGTPSGIRIALCLCDPGQPQGIYAMVACTGNGILRPGLTPTAVPWKLPLGKGFLEALGKFLPDFIRRYHRLLPP